VSAEIPSIPRAAGLAWSDAGRVLVALSVPALFAVIVIAALTVGQELASPPLRSQSARLAPWLILVVTMVLQALVLTPYLLAVHRFLAFREKTAGYAPGLAATARYFGWLLAVSALVWLPFGLPALMTSNLDRAIGIFAILAAVVVFICIRIILVFPAVALKAPNAGAAAAWADSAGHAWRAFWILLFVLIPWAAVFAAALIIEVSTSATPARPPAFGASMLVSSIVQAAIIVAGHTLVFAMASRFYEWAGERVEPEPVAAPAKGKRDRPRDRHRRKD
jgi:hypothetical protein